MPLYLCGESALVMWRHMRVNNLFDPVPLKVSRKSSIRDALHTKHQLNTLSSSAIELLEAIPKPYHVLVSSKKERRKSKTIKPHVWSRPLPRGTFVDLGGEIFLSSGPFLFLQLANMYDLHRAVKYGLELCGIYSIKAPYDAWRTSTDPSETHFGSITGVAPATSVARIKLFLEGCDGQVGHREADTALQYVIDDSGSPMETAAYMFACLPKRYGGHGIKKPIFNPALTVTTKEGSRKRRPDLYWPAQSVDVEYNSDLIHIAKDQYYKDAKRQVELAASSVRVLPLTRNDVVSTDNFDRFAFGLAKVLGIRQRAYPPNWEERRLKLRNAVLFDR